MAVNSSDFQSKLGLSHAYCLHLFTTIATHRLKAYDFKQYLLSNFKTNQRDFYDNLVLSYETLTGQNATKLSITTFPDYLLLLFTQISANDISENATNLLLDIKNNTTSIAWIPSDHRLRALASSFTANNNSTAITFSTTQSQSDSSQEPTSEVSQIALMQPLSQISEMLQQLQDDSSSLQTSNDSHLSAMNSSISTFATTCLDLFKHMTPSSTKNEHYNDLDFMLDRRQRYANTLAIHEQYIAKQVFPNKLDLQEFPPTFYYQDPEYNVEYNACLKDCQKLISTFFINWHKTKINKLDSDIKNKSAFITKIDTDANTMITQHTKQIEEYYKINLDKAFEKINAKQAKLENHNQSNNYNNNNKRRQPTSNINNNNNNNKNKNNNNYNNINNNNNTNNKRMPPRYSSHNATANQLINTHRQPPIFAQQQGHHSIQPLMHPPHQPQFQSSSYHNSFQQHTNQPHPYY